MCFYLLFLILVFVKFSILCQKSPVKPTKANRSSFSDQRRTWIFQQYQIAKSISEMVVVIHHHLLEDIVATGLIEQCLLSATNCYYFSDQTNQVQPVDLKCIGMVLLKVKFIYSEKATKILKCANFGFDRLEFPLQLVTPFEILLGIICSKLKVSKNCHLSCSSKLNF